MIKPNEIVHVLLFMLSLWDPACVSACGTSLWSQPHSGHFMAAGDYIPGAPFHEGCVPNVSHCGCELGSYSLSVSASPCSDTWRLCRRAHSRLECPSLSWAGLVSAEWLPFLAGGLPLGAVGSAAAAVLGPVRLGIFCSHLSVVSHLDVCLCEQWTVSLSSVWHLSSLSESSALFVVRVFPSGGTLSPSPSAPPPLCPPRAALQGRAVLSWPRTPRQAGGCAFAHTACASHSGLT